jgi:hypothetical protein
MHGAILPLAAHQYVRPPGTSTRARRCSRCSARSPRGSTSSAPSGPTPTGVLAARRSLSTVEPLPLWSSAHSRSCSQQRHTPTGAAERARRTRWRHALHTRMSTKKSRPQPQAVPLSRSALRAWPADRGRARTASRRASPWPRSRSGPCPAPPPPGQRRRPRGRCRRAGRDRTRRAGASRCCWRASR